MENNKRILIVGGTSGIGLETAKKFSANLFDVFVIGRNKERGLNAVYEIKKIIGGKATFIQKSVGFEEITQEELNIKPDIIVHCAGIFEKYPTNIEDYNERYIRTKLGGFDYCLKHIEGNPHIKSLVAISSLYTFLPDTFSPKTEKYTNLELEKRVKDLSKELAGVVNINCIAPGLVDTPLTQKAFGKQGISDILSNSVGSRIVQPEEIANKIYELYKDKNVTGEVITVDGGFLKNFLNK